ncbi:hypothetical protein [Streptomyces sp. NPDC057740]|uniref:hypothetical protein n=1 Tax=Streptomyces sp. NPDC057740 TaxID=3346234 RepID=UPI0036A3A439
MATRADRQLAMISAGMESGSIALSGPRGVGKTQLLRNFCKVDAAKLLARAQREIGTGDTLARSTLQRVRTAWLLPAPASAPPV